MKVSQTMTKSNMYKFDEAELNTLATIAVREANNSNEMAALKPMFEGWYKANKHRFGSHDKIATIAKMFVDDLPVTFDDKRQKLGPKGDQSLTLYGAYVHKARHGLTKLHKTGATPSPWALTATGVAKLADLDDEAILTLIRVEIEQRTGG